MKKSERNEGWMRLLIAIVCGFIFYFWSLLAIVLTVVHWLYIIVLGARSRPIAEVIEAYNSFVYISFRYISGVSNERPFPWNRLTPMSKFS